VLFQPSHQVKAQSKEIGIASFIGTISPIRGFYKGEYANSNDFKIDGKFFDTETGLEIAKYDWKIYAFKAVNNNVAYIKLKHLPSMELDNQIYNDIDIKVRIKTKDFNPNLHLQTYSTLYTNESNLYTIFNSGDFKFRNSLGKVVLGEFKYNNTTLKRGWNYIKYTFIPYKVLETDYGYEEYETKTGVIKINLDTSNLAGATIGIEDAIGGFDFENAPTLSETELALKIGEQYDFDVKNKVDKSKYYYTSLSSKVASITPYKGIITGKEEGTTTIYCKVTLPDGQIGFLKCKVTVNK
jgi:hypothetical protein